MGKKPPRRQKQGRVEPGEALPFCPYCGTTDAEKAALSRMDRLLQLHTELCAALRLAGRQMLRFEKQEDESLQRLRKVLKRADNLHKALKGPDQLPEAGVPTPPSEYRSDHAGHDGPLSKGIQSRDPSRSPASAEYPEIPDWMKRGVT